MVAFGEVRYNITSLYKYLGKPKPKTERLE